MLKISAIAAAAALTLGTALAQDRPPSVPTGADVKGEACFRTVQKPDDTEKVRVVRCDSTRQIANAIRND